MINLNNTTKQAQHFIDSYSKAHAITVCALYKNPSIAKREAEREIRRRMTMVNGTAYNYKVWGATPHFYTAGYLLRSNGGDNNLYLIVETSINTYKIDVEHLHEQI